MFCSKYNPKRTYKLARALRILLTHFPNLFWKRSSAVGPAIPPEILNISNMKTLAEY